MQFFDKANKKVVLTSFDVLSGGLVDAEPTLLCKILHAFMYGKWVTCFYVALISAFFNIFLRTTCSNTDKMRPGGYCWGVKITPVCQILFYQILQDVLCNTKKLCQQLFVFLDKQENDVNIHKNISTIQLSM